MPKNGCVFPYSITLSENGVVNVFPTAEILITTKEGEQMAFLLLVDSGATTTALPKHDAEAIGIKAENGSPFLITGIGGETINGWKHEVNIEQGEEKFKIPLAFLDGNTPRVLGREKIFDQFNIIFEENRRRTTFVKTHSEEGNSISEIISLLGKPN